MNVWIFIATLVGAYIAASLVVALPFLCDKDWKEALKVMVLWPLRVFRPVAKMRYLKVPIIGRGRSKTSHTK